MKSETFRLFKNMPSFVGGMAAVVSFDEDIFDSLNTHKTDAQADNNSLASDWKAVGDDLRTSLQEYEPGA